MIIYDHYKDHIYETWYDSTNTIYSKCYDSESDTVTVNIVFKGGRTYKYRKVSKSDYLLFKTAESNGKALNEFIKKYECVRIADTDLEKLEEYRKSLIDETENIQKTPLEGLSCNIEYNPQTQQFALSMNGKQVFSGTEGQVSIFNLLKALKINATVTETNAAELFTSDEEADKIEL